MTYCLVSDLLFGFWLIVWVLTYCLVSIIYFPSTSIICVYVYCFWLTMYECLCILSLVDYVWVYMYIVFGWLCMSVYVYCFWLTMYKCICILFLVDYVWVYMYIVFGWLCMSVYVYCLWLTMYECICILFLVDYVWVYMYLVLNVHIKIDLGRTYSFLCVTDCTYTLSRQQIPDWSIVNAKYRWMISYCVCACILLTTLVFIYVLSWLERTRTCSHY